MKKFLCFGGVLMIAACVLPAAESDSATVSKDAAQRAADLLAEMQQSAAPEAERTEALKHIRATQALLDLGHAEQAFAAFIKLNDVLKGYAPAVRQALRADAEVGPELLALTRGMMNVGQEPEKPAVADSATESVTDSVTSSQEVVSPATDTESAVIEAVVIEAVDTESAAQP